MTASSFAALGVQPRLCTRLAELGLHQPTPIQLQAIPELLDGQDVLGIAQTGTGKTAAFGLPLLQRLLEDNQPAESRAPLALILAPTRELAAQITEVLNSYSVGRSIRLCCIFGGVGQGRQVQALKAGVDILVATPGRLLDLLGQGELRLDQIHTLILDEADRLLDLGFARDIKKVVAAVPAARHTLLFSATMPKSVTALADSILSHPTRIDVSPKQVTARKIDQQLSFVPKSDKQYALATLLRDPAVEKAIVFTRTKHGADRVAKKLTAAGIGAAAIHGNKSQNARTRALNSFLSGDCWALVATDIAARGIDISGVSHVINFELPQDPESYVHRIGRTGRAGAAGCAWTLVADDERKGLSAIEKLIRTRLEVRAIDYSAERSAAQERAQGQGQTAAADAPGPGQSEKQREGQRRSRRAKQGSAAPTRNSRNAPSKRRRRRRGRPSSGQSANA